MAVHVVHVLDTSAMGGTETTLVSLVRRLDRERFTPAVVLSPAAQHLSLGPMLEETGASVTFCPMPRNKWDGSALAGLTRRLRRLSPAVVHVHLPYTLANRHAFIAARAARCPVVVSTEQLAVQPSFFRTLRAVVTKQILVALQDAVIATSEYVRTRLIEAAHIPPQKVVTIYNAVDIPEDLPASSDDRIRLELGLDPGTPLVGMIARIDPKQKRFEDFLRAAPRITRELPHVHFLIGGTGEPQHCVALHALVRDLNLGGRVHFLGFRVDAPRIIAALNVLVLASEYEGFPLVTLEAMARKIPVVATDIGGVHEQIIHGETGYLVPPRDVAALSEAVLTVLRDPAQAGRVAQQARRTVEQRFDARAMAERVQALYLRMLAHREYVPAMRADPVTGED